MKRGVHFAVLLVTACSQDEKSGTPPKTAAGLSCPAVQAGPDSVCCPDGAFFDAKSSACVAVGPPDCASQVFVNPAACTPNWCARWTTANGQACEPGAKSPAESCGVLDPNCGPGSAACAVGLVNTTQGCQVAGTGVELPNGSTLSAPVGADTPFAVPPVPALAAPLPPLGCLTFLPPGDAKPDCATVSTCPAGEELGATGKCAPRTGVEWACPPGFVSDAAQPNECTPDPSECGAEQYATGPQDAIHIDASASAPGNGTKSSPYPSLAAAAAAFSPGATLLLAAGTYQANFNLHKDITIAGRCAAMVTLQASASGPAIAAKSIGPPLTAVITGVRITGGTVGVAALSGASVKLRKVLVSKAIQAGIYATDSASLHGEDLVVVDAGAASTGGLSMGATAQFGASIGLVRAHFARNRGYGISIVQGGKLVATDVVIAAMTADTTGEGRGIEVHANSSVVVTGLRISAAISSGIRAAGGGATVQVTNAAILDTLPQVKTKLFGRGIDLGKGAQATLRGVFMSGHCEAAVFAIDPLTNLDAIDLGVHATKPRAIDGTYGLGIHASAGASAQLRRVWASGNHSVGIAAGANSLVNLSLALVEKTLPAGGGEFGRGLDIAAGSKLELSDVRVSANRDAGITVYGGHLVAKGLTVDTTIADDHLKGGAGISIAANGSLNVTDARLSGNRVGLTMNGGTASLARLTIDNGQPASDGVGGYGMVFDGGASMDLAQVLISGGRAAGIALSGAGTKLRGRNLVVQGVAPRQLLGGDGVGLAVLMGARAELTGLIVQDCHTAGVMVAFDGSSAAVANASLTGNRQGESSGEGRGLVVQTGATAHLAGARVIDNQEAGVLVHTATLHAVGLLVRSTRESLKKLGGAGIAVAGPGAKLHLDSSVLVGNRSAALVVDVGAAWLRQVVLANTTFGDLSSGQSGKNLALADGLAAHDAMTVDLQQCVIAANYRSGILVDGGAANVTATVITGGLFGVVVQRMAAWQAKALALFGNTQQNFASDQGLDVPTAPQPVAIGDFEP